MSTGFISLTQTSLYRRLISSPMPVHHRGCISECDHHPYGEHDPTIAVCVVQAECWEDQHETGHRSALVTLSSQLGYAQDMPRIRRMLLRWNVLNLLSCPAYVAHVSLPYSNVLITQAMYTAILVFTEGLSTLELCDERELKLPSQSSCRSLRPMRGCQ